MKRYTLFIAISIIIIFTMVISIYLFTHSVSINVSFAQSAFIRIVDYNQIGEKMIELDESERKILASLFDKRAWTESPSCPCYGVEIIFKSRNEKIIIHPAGDGCSTMRIEKDKTNYYFHLRHDEYIILETILNKYGIKYPFGL